MQWDFVAAVMEHLGGIHTAVETSGMASDEVFTEMMEKTDLVMMDWKVSDPELHLRYTGADQKPIRRHLKMLASGNTPFILRMPIIPGVNDNQEHFETTAEMVEGSRMLQRVDILPYQRAAGAKYAMVGRKYDPDFDENKSVKMFPEVLEKRGISCQVFR